MITLGRQLDIWDDPDFPFPRKERDFVQLRVAFTPGRQAVLSSAVQSLVAALPSVCSSPGRPGPI